LLRPLRLRLDLLPLRKTAAEIGAKEFALDAAVAYFITTRVAYSTMRTRSRVLAQQAHRRGRLDVWAKEPPAQDHPLLQFDNVPRARTTAGVTNEARRTWAGLPPSQILDGHGSGRRASSNQGLA